jgi:hypothetical protein
MLNVVIVTILCCWYTVQAIVSDQKDTDTLINTSTLEYDSLVEKNIFLQKPKKTFSNFSKK